ncbi:MAG TPA: efflux RND transporter periplasmic adaptor subunit [Acidobacteriota bacterium]|nr:efflux RND transporter periplasmic adaptor subunit [Acidobacteriota bacterium]
MSKFIRLPKNLWAILIVAAVLVGVLLSIFGLWDRKNQNGDYITANVERGTVKVTVSATGTLQAVITVQVGSQVSGTVSWLGADFNSHVKRGQLIAKLDPALFQTQVENARANVTNAQAAVQAATVEISNQRANLLAAKANMEVARVQRDDAIALVKRYQELKELVSSRDLEAAQAQANAGAGRYEQAGAQVVQAQAAINTAQAKLEQAKASLAQARAQLEQAQVNLAHTIIASPIDGIVVSRNVDIGQTVAASLQAPTLFVIADDLTKMQALAAIDEADVGQVHEGMPANFTVDAYPGENFMGRVTQVRLGAQTQQNVVTYTAVIEVANPELKLRPGMTSNVVLPVAQRDNVLNVPNAALRFKPNLSEKDQQELAERLKARGEKLPSDLQQEQPAGSQVRQEGQGRRPSSADGGQRPGFRAMPGRAGTTGGGPRRQNQTVWLLSQGKLEPRSIRTGITNGRVTEIVSGDLHQGDAVVIGQNESASGSRPATTPGQPRPPGFGGFGGPGGGGPRR